MFLDKSLMSFWKHWKVTFGLSIALISVSPVNHALAQGDKVGGGADLLECRVPGSGLVKRFLLDLREIQGYSPDLPTTQDFMEIVQEFHARLAAKDPTRADEYRDFVLRTHEDVVSLSEGRAAPNQIVEFTRENEVLEDIDDSNEVAIPAGCKKFQWIAQTFENNTTRIRWQREWILGAVPVEQYVGALYHEAIYRELLPSRPTDSRAVRTFVRTLANPRGPKVIESFASNYTDAQGKLFELSSYAMFIAYSGPFDRLKLLFKGKNFLYLGAKDPIATGSSVEDTQYKFQSGYYLSHTRKQRIFVYDVTLNANGELIEARFKDGLAAVGKTIQLKPSVNGHAPVFSTIRPSMNGGYVIENIQSAITGKLIPRVFVDESFQVLNIESTGFFEHEFGADYQDAIYQLLKCTQETKSSYRRPKDLFESRLTRVRAALRQEDLEGIREILAECRSLRTVGEELATVAPEVLAISEKIFNPQVIDCQETKTRVALAVLVGGMVVVNKRVCEYTDGSFRQNKRTHFIGGFGLGLTVRRYRDRIEKRDPRGRLSYDWNSVELSAEKGDGPIYYYYDEKDFWRPRPDYPSRFQVVRTDYSRLVRNVLADIVE